MIVMFLHRRSKKLFDIYEERIGALVENIDYSTKLKRMVVASFVAKRILFAAGVWFLKLELIIINVEIAFFSILLILVARPYLELQKY